MSRPIERRRRGAQRLAALITVCTGAAAAAATPAVAATTGWSRATEVEPGINPVLTYSPTGAAALGAELTSRGTLTGTAVNLSANGSSFATSPWRLTATSAGHGVEPLTGLALSSEGYLAASFGDVDAAAPELARVADPSNGFGKTQQLVAVGHAPTGQSTPDTLALLATTAGEVVGAGADDSGELTTASLGAKQTTFRTAAGPAGLAATDAYALAADTSGNTFLAGDGANGCTAVAMRKPHASFATTYRTGNCSTATPNVFDAITATGNGDAALLTEDVSEAGTVASRLFIQVGRDGHFGPATQLGGALGGSVALASDADGELTAEWTDCDTGPIVNGQLSSSDCQIDAATGSITGGFSAAAAPGVTVATAQSGTTLQALTSDRAVAVSRCSTATCQFEVFTARPGGGFRPGHVLGTGSKLIALVGDSHGNLLTVWTNAKHQLYAATGSAASGRWSADERLSNRAVTPSQVTAAYGPHGRAIVAWSSQEKIDAAAWS